MARPEILAMQLNYDDTSGWQTLKEMWPTLDVPHGWVKTLSEDPDTGEHTTVCKLPAGWSTPTPEIHSDLQEVFLVEGDMTTSGISLTAPAYLSLPGGTQHGPTSTKNGLTMIVVHYGKFDITYNR